MNPYYVMIVLSVILPLLNGLAFKYTSNPNLLRLANAVLAFVAQAINFALQSDHTYLFDNAWWEYVMASFLTLVISQAAYLNIYVPLKLTSRPDGVLPTASGIALGVRAPAEFPVGLAPIERRRKA